MALTVLNAISQDYVRSDPHILYVLRMRIAYACCICALLYYDKNIFRNMLIERQLYFIKQNSKQNIRMYVVYVACILCVFCVYYICCVCVLHMFILHICAAVL